MLDYSLRVVEDADPYDCVVETDLWGTAVSTFHFFHDCVLKQICRERRPRRSVFLPKPPKGTVPFGGVEKSGLSIVIFSGRQGGGCPPDTRTLDLPPCCVVYAKVVLNIVKKFVNP